MANTKISALTAGSAVGGTEKLPALQSGANVYLTPTQLADFVEGRASLPELIRDTMATAIVAGTNMTITVDDPGNTITFAAAGAGGGAAGTTTNPLTMNNSGSGSASGATFDGSAPITLSWNTIGAQPHGHPGYIAGNWYQPIQGTVAAGAAPGTGSIRLIPFMLRRPITIQALAVRIATLAAAGNCQAAIYASNATTGRPTGNALASTASMSTGTAAVVSASVTAATLSAGVVYWMAVNQDNATVVYQSLNTAFAQHTFLIGTATLANVAGSNSGGNIGLSVAQTFGTWPDLTSATFVEVAVASSGASALVFMQAA